MNRITSPGERPGIKNLLNDILLTNYQRYGIIFKTLKINFKGLLFLDSKLYYLRIKIKIWTIYDAMKGGIKLIWNYLKIL